MTIDAPAVRLADLSNIDIVGSALGAAFDADPVLNWMLRDDERRSWAIETFLRETTRHRYLHLSHSYLLEDGSGAAIWAPPDAPEPGPTPELDAILAEAVAPRGYENRNAVDAALAGKHPTRPHYYLFAIGVRPGVQSRGLGARLIAPVLEHCDAADASVYLVSSNAQNHTFYFRHGFEVVEQVDVPGGPSLWPMWRDPQ